jgi:hypothetical protein
MPTHPTHYNLGFASGISSLVLNVFLMSSAWLPRRAQPTQCSSRPQIPVHPGRALASSFSAELRCAVFHYANVIPFLNHGECTSSFADIPRRIPSLSRNLRVELPMPYEYVQGSVVAHTSSGSFFNDPNSVRIISTAP